MRGFWALPAVVQVVVANHYWAFTAVDDILAYPQFEVIGSTKVLSEAEADAKIAALSSRASPSASAPGAEPAFELSQFGSDDDPTASASDRDDGTETIRAYERLRLGEQQYLCSIPYPIIHSDTVDSAPPEERKAEVARATKHGSELLKGMEGSCIFFNTGYWTYSFCYNQSIKQFHSLPPGKHMFPPVEDTSVHSFVLGTFGTPSGKAPNKKDKAQSKQTIEAGQKSGAGDVSATRVSGVQNATGTSLARLGRRGKLQYLVQELTGGTKCDLTGKPRRIEVEFHCAPGLNGDKIAVIKETSTCMYHMVVETSRLCNDLAFQPPEKETPNHLLCAPVIPNGAALQDFPALASAIARREEPQREEPIIDIDFPIYIGDMEFGGNRLLSSPPDNILDDADLDAELKAISKTGWLRDRPSLADSLVLGGRREKLIATVASSTMDPLTDAELKKLDFRPREIVDIAGFRKQVEKLSKGKRWQLDVVETSQGKEYRAIIDKDEKDQNKKAGEGAKKEGEKSGTKGGLKKGEKAAAEEQADNEGSDEVYKDEL